MPFISKVPGAGVIFVEDKQTHIRKPKETQTGPHGWEDLSQAHALQNFILVFASQETSLGQCAYTWQALGDRGSNISIPKVDG